MPLIQHSNLPTFDRLRQEGQTVLRDGQAANQEIRELHIGLLNMMPDAALEATERQFFRLIGESNSIAQFHVHPFTLPIIKRGEKAQLHIEKYYRTFKEIQAMGLDALIISGAAVTHLQLSDEVYFEPLGKVLEWSYQNVTSTLCSCLATHASLESQYSQPRYRLDDKRWGVFMHRVTERQHPLVHGINTRFDVPHSRHNQIDRSQFEKVGLHVLAESDEAGVQMAVSADGFRTVYFQGHPEYDSISLLKEYKREVGVFSIAYNRFIEPSDEYIERPSYPPFPYNYFDSYTQAIFNEYRYHLINAIENATTPPIFPEKLILNHIDNSWHDTAAAIMANWMGLTYQLTNMDRKLPFMEGIDSSDPLGLYKTL